VRRLVRALMAAERALLDRDGIPFKKI